MNRETVTRRALVSAIAAVFALFALWTGATWVFEGRIETFLRPEALADRSIYTIIANLLIGTVIAIAIVRFLIGRGWHTRTAAGFGRSTPSALRLRPSLMITALAAIVVLAMSDWLLLRRSGGPSH